MVVIGQMESIYEGVSNQTGKPYKRRQITVFDQEADRVRLF